MLADPQTDAVRIFHDAADGIPGLVIEQLGDVLVAQLHEERLAINPDDAHHICNLAKERRACCAVYRKVYPRDRSAALARLEESHTDPTPWIGEPSAAEFAVRDNGLRYLVRPYDGYSTGLFLEHRTNRARLHASAKDRRVLNTFAYTCAYSVAAAAGGAAEVVSVDVSRKYLNWGRQNFAANDLPTTPHAFLSADIFDYLRRAARQNRRFDLIVLDPPTFGRARRPRRTFSIRADLDRLVEEAVAILDPAGELLLCSNNRDTSLRRLEQAIATAAPSRRFQIVARPTLPTDFAGDADYAKSIWVRFDQDPA